MRDAKNDGADCAEADVDEKHEFAALDVGDDAPNAAAHKSAEEIRRREEAGIVS